MKRWKLCVDSDIDEKTLEIAKINAHRAGVSDKIIFEKRDIKDFAPETERGTVIVNPPYGERLLDSEEASRIYKIMGEKFISRRGWAYYIISPSEDFEYDFGRKADKRRKLYNGMIKCNLYMYFKWFLFFSRWRKVKYVFIVNPVAGKKKAGEFIPEIEKICMDKILDEVYFALQWLESNTHLSLAIRMEDWSSLGQHKRKSEFPVVTRESHRNS